MRGRQARRRRRARARPARPQDALGAPRADLLPLGVEEHLRRDALIGIGDASTSLLVAQFEGAEATLAPIEAIIEGERIPLGELASQDSRSAAGSSKAQRIAQHFKITADELSVSSLEDAVVTRIATKEYF